ncbi:MAG: ABC transporter permease, partial [Martelella sp.]
MSLLSKNRHWLLSAPALILFAAFLLAPLAMTFILSFHQFDFYQGIDDSYRLSNYAEVLGDGYFYEIFGRTFAIALVTTFLCIVIGVPASYFLNRMRPGPRSIMILVVLGPL